MWKFEQWKQLLDGGDEMLQRMYTEGEAILRAHNQNVQSVVKGGVRTCEITLPRTVLISPDAQAEIAKRDERIKELEEREQILVRANSSANILNNELAAQNQQLHEALNEAGRLYCTMIGNDLMHNPSMFARNTVCTYVRSWFRKCKPKVIESALSLHDLASPVLNRVKAEALRYAADEFDAQGEWKGHGQQLRNMADAIEKGEGNATD